MVIFLAVIIGLEIHHIQIYIQYIDNKHNSSHIAGLMRQRKVKNLETKYEDYNDILMRDPCSYERQVAESASGQTGIS